MAIAVYDIGHDQAFGTLAAYDAGETAVVMLHDARTDTVGAVRLKLLVVGGNSIEAVDPAGRPWQFHHAGPAYCTDSARLLNVLIDFTR